MQRAVVVLFLFVAASCLTTVDQRWCDRSQPCSPGFVCTPDFHCVLAPRHDGGTGGGGGALGGGGGALGGGGGALGGGGGRTGGGGGGGPLGGGGGFGGGSVCDNSSCDGCCAGFAQCVPLADLDERRCGGGVTCVACRPGERCAGRMGCVPATGGGGGSSCSPATCPDGCCSGDRCVRTTFQGDSSCGLRGAACQPCAMGDRCVFGTCTRIIDVDGGQPGAVGSPCRTDFDCGNDGFAFCIPGVSEGEPTGFEGGYCSRLCDNSPCPTGARCVPAEDGAGGEVNICLAGCMTSSQCRMGYFCELGFGPGVCVP